MYPIFPQVNATHNHGLADAHATKPRGVSEQVSLALMMGDEGNGGDGIADPTPNTNERARQKAYAAMMAAASATAAKLADSVSPAAATSIFAEAMAVANTRLLAAGVGGPLLPPSESCGDGALLVGSTVVSTEPQTETISDCAPTSA